MPRNDRSARRIFSSGICTPITPVEQTKSSLRRAPQPLRGFGYGALRGGVSRRASGAVGIAGVYHHGSHAAFGHAQVWFWK